MASVFHKFVDSWCLEIFVFQINLKFNLHIHTEHNIVHKRFLAVD